MKHLPLVVVLGFSAAFAQTGLEVKHVQPGTGLIAQGVWAGDTLYVSGQVADPITPAANGKPAVYGDTKAQAINVFAKIEKFLKEQGLGMGNVVMMHVYMVGDPATGGRLDFAGMNSIYSQHFGTAAQPNKPARSTVQVAALAAVGPLVEIEVIAVRPKR